MLAFIPFPFRKPIGSFHHQDQFANQSAMMGHPILIGIRSASPVESRLPRAREDPCLFRTRLNDGDRETIFDSTDMIDSDDELKFDDSQCISVGRTPGKIAAVLRTPAPVLESHGREFDNQVGIAKEFGPHLYSVPADLIGPQESEEVEPVFPRNNNNSIFFATIDDYADTEMVNRISTDETSTLLPRLNQQNSDTDTDSAEMETMNMPFWHLPDRRQTKRSHHHHHHPLYPGEADNTSSILLPEDDMSIISDVSLIPTYFPSDIMSNKRKRTHHYHHHRALIKRLIVAKARAARQTVRQLKRTCRDAVANAFVGESAGVEYRPTKCVQIGAAY